MLEAIRRFYAERIHPADSSEDDQQHGLQLATAALLIEMAQEDNERHSVEFQAIHEGVREVFALSDEDTTALIELADHEAHEATDHFAFTNLINQHFDYPQRCKVVELLWRVCLSDADMDRYEERLVRKIAGLLYIEHHDYIAAKLRVKHDYSSSYLGEYDGYE